MSADLDRTRRRRATRRLMVGGFVVAAILLVFFAVWPFLEPGRFSPGPHPSQSTSGQAGADQRAGESGAAKSEIAPGDPSGGRARDIKQTAEPVSLSPDQRQRLRQVITQQNPPHADQIPFSLEIGEAVPQEVKLSDLPNAASEILNGYMGQQYVIVRDKLVIVDRLTRRVGAIIPDMT